MKTHQDDPAEDQANDNDEYATRDQPEQQSFYDRHGFDERDGPPWQEEDDPEKHNELWGNSGLRRW